MSDSTCNVYCVELSGKQRNGLGRIIFIIFIVIISNVIDNTVSHPIYEIVMILSCKERSDR